MSGAKRSCCERVYPSGSVSGYACQITAKVERDGRWYCRTHDPVARKERDAKRQAAWRAERNSIAAAREKENRIRNAENMVVQMVLASSPNELPAPVIAARAALIECRAPTRSSGEQT